MMAAKCSKRKYPTRKLAKAARRQYMNVWSETKDKHIYRCPACGYFHLGRKPPMRVLAHGRATGRFT